MKLLLVTAYFPPDTGSAAHLFYELGKVLVKKGCEVTVLTGFPFYYAQGDLTCYKQRNWMTENTEGMKVVRVRVAQLPRHIPVFRGIWQFITAFIFTFAGMIITKPDISIVYSPPLPLALTAYVLKKIKKVPFILNVQDIFPQSAIDLGILRNRLLIHFFEKLELFSYRKADWITVHSPSNREWIIKKGATPEKVKIIPNCVDTDFIRPAERTNSFREEYNLGDKFIVSFVGVLGYSQDLDIVLESASVLKNYKDILFLIVGNGVEKVRLENKSYRMGNRNIRFIPMQPRERYPLILQASDISLATLREEVRTPVVPSKILSIMSAGKPVIICMDLSGDAAKIVKDSQCGYALPAGDFQGLSDAILKLYYSPQLREEFGDNGRSYCEKYVSLEKSAEEYINLFSQITQKVEVGL